LPSAFVFNRAWRPRFGHALACWSWKRTISRRRLRRPHELIHGGLRYLEYYEFRLVSESREREVLRAAPHIVSPLQFVLPHEHLRRHG
jgi:hypothetical protein